MDRYPAMDVYFPHAREADLLGEMTRNAAAPWSAMVVDALGRVPEPGAFYFHRDVIDGAPSCTVCMRRNEPGKFVVVNIVPDEGQGGQISIEDYKSIITDFDSKVAEPAALVVGGMTAVEISVYRLEDYFSPRSVELLKQFCGAANHGDLGSHPSDQDRWMAFLVSAYDERNDVHCDVFGACLKNERIWPEHGVRQLVREFDFSMRLLKHVGR